MSQATMAMEEETDPKIIGLRYGKPPNPPCPVHGCAMIVECTRQGVQYLYCKVPGCRESCTRYRRRAA